MVDGWWCFFAEVCTAMWGMQKNHPAWTMNVRIKAFFPPSWIVLRVCLKNRQNMSKIGYSWIPQYTPKNPQNSNGLSWFIIFSPYFLNIRHEHLRFLSGDFLGWLWSISQAHDKRDWTALTHRNNGEMMGKWLGSACLESVPPWKFDLVLIHDSRRWWSSPARVQA
jgi:hypothetical protein